MLKPDGHILILCMEWLPYEDKIARARGALWEQEHKKLLSEIAPQEFDILHYAAIAALKVKK